MNTLELFSLKGRKALITGSSRGIGFALAQGLAGAGAEIILNGRNQMRLSEAAMQLRDTGATVHQLPFDAADPVDAKRAIDRFEQDIGAIDILVNNAGMQFRTPLEDYPPAKFDELMRTNVNSVFYVGQAAAKHMIARGRGKIINICSINSALARPTIAPYTASKGAVANLTKGMATDWAKHGLHINGLAPGYFKTELNEALVSNPEFTQWLEKRTPMARWGDVSELVGAAVFLASDASSFVNGHILYVDGAISATL
ncbi:SDR family oxidoreductase [Pelagibacterium lentulum]|uniref:Gluconate 5-dehydrogenase n=1 Tax=Pelagibacterium lentulum TaxID=2029865 RepID=A0A916RMN3_9HYPH|nr:SDR family oxidoreductase [Pelagibacterium lentulum]GGA60866.1 gluconate 5-dehydrogenase [Pelagibacterium lentulum]